MKLFKKFLAVFVVLSMFVTLIPIGSFANNGVSSTNAVIEPINLTTLSMPALSTPTPTPMPPDMANVEAWKPIEDNGDIQETPQDTITPIDNNGNSSNNGNNGNGNNGNNGNGKGNTIDKNQVANYIVKFKDSSKKDKAEKDLEKQNKKIEKDLKKSNALSVDMSLEDIKSLTNASDIESIEPDYEVQTEDVDTVTWGVNAVQVPTVQSNGVTGQGVKVAVLDTGIAPNDDLKVAGGVSFVDGEDSYIDENGHGTHVAGIIAAQANNMGIVGVAPNVELYAVKVLDKNGRGNYSNIIAGIEWAIDNKMDVINMSFGGNNDSQILAEAMDLAYQNNIILVASAGNSGDNGNGDDTVTYPAKYDSVIAVAAVDESLQRANFSSVGKEVEVAAPGVAIESTYLNNTYQTLSGTSMAAPFVTGVAALIKSKYKNETNVQVREQLDNSAVNSNGQRDVYYGDGIVNAERAIGVTSTVPKGPANDSNNTNNGNNGKNDKIENTYPFSITAIDGSSISVGINSTLASSDSVSVTIASKDTKDIAFQGTITNGQTIANLTANQEYALSIKGIKGNMIESYTADLVLVSTPQNKNKNNYSISLDNIYKNTYDSSKLIPPSNGNLTEDEAAALEAQSSGTRYESNQPNETYSTAMTTYDDWDNYGLIDSATDQDWYKVNFSSMGYANFWLQVPAGFDYDLELYASNGTTLLASSRNGAGMDELISQYYVTANTNYYIRVFGYGGSNTVSTYYLMRAKNYPTPSTSDVYEPNNSRATASTIGLNSSITQANIDVPTDEDYYAFTLTSHSQITLSLSAIPTGCDYDLQLQNSSGTVLATSQNGGNTMEQIATDLQPGTYYARVYSWSGSSTSKYLLSLASSVIIDPDVYEPNDDTAHATGITIGNTISNANLNTQADTDIYKFTLSSTKAVTINLANIPSGCDYDLNLYNGSGGNPISTSRNAGNAAESISQTLTSGTYYIMVYSYIGCSASFYTLSTSQTDPPDDFGNDFAHATSINVSGTAVTNISGALDYQGDQDYMKFTVPTTGTYSFETISSIDTYGYLYNSSQGLLAYNDDGAGNGYNFKITYNLTAGTTYVLNVCGYSASVVGSYTLKITPPQPSLNVGDTFTTTLNGQTATLQITNLGTNPTVTLTGMNVPSTGDLSIPSTATYLGITFQITTLGDNVFSGCQTLKSVTLAEGILVIGNNTFFNCSNLSSVTFPNGFQRTYNWAFANTALTSLTLPNSMTCIAWASFQNCTKLTSVSIGTGVTWIEGYAFDNCSSLKSLTLPSSVGSLQYACFSNLSSLTNFTYLSENPYNISQENVFINTNTSNITLSIPAGKTQTYINAGWTGFKSTNESAGQNLVYLSDMAWISSYSREQTNRDRSDGGNTITMGGVTYAKGIGNHANSEVQISLGGKYQTFKASVGIDDESSGQGQATFYVYGDGVLLYQLYKTPGIATDISVDVSNVNTLRIVTDNNGTDWWNHTDWANARVIPKTTSNYISDMTWISSINGWGPVERDMSNGETNANDGRTITVGGVSYAKGIGCHANSEIQVALDGSSQTFNSVIGLDGEVGSAGNVIFKVYGDNVLLYQSPVMTGGAAQSISVDVSGRSVLKLVVDMNGDNNSDHADWANAMLVPKPAIANGVVPNNTSLLVWPASSTEITLRYGEVDSTYNVAHTGIDVQGTDGSSVYSAADGIVAYVGTNAYYGNVVYVNSRYNGNYIQIRYAHLKNGTIGVVAGNAIHAGDLIGDMGSTGQVSINNSSEPCILEMEVLQSTNGQVCATNGSNTTKVNPLNYFPTVVSDGYYMMSPYNYSINVNGVNTQSAYDTSYLANTNLPDGKAYLRKIVEECMREKNGNNNADNINANLTYNSSTGVATVYLNGKSRDYSVANALATNMNDRLVVDYADFINYFYRTDSIVPYSGDAGSQIAAGDDALPEFVQVIINGKYKDGKGGLSEIWDRANTWKQPITMQAVADEANKLRNVCTNYNYTTKPFNRAYFMNNQYGAYLGFDNFGHAFGHTALLLVNSDNVGLSFSYHPYPDGSPLSPGDMRFTILNASEVSDLLYGDGVVDTEFGMCSGKITEQYNRFVYMGQSSLLNATLNIAASWFANPPEYIGVGNQCDNVTQKLLHAAQINYTIDGWPNNTYDRLKNVYPAWALY